MKLQAGINLKIDAQKGLYICTICQGSTETQQPTNFLDN